MSAAQPPSVSFQHPIHRRSSDAQRLGDQSCDLILALLASSISREHIDVPLAKSSGSRPPCQCGQHTPSCPHARSRSLVARRRTDDFIASSATCILCRAQPIAAQEELGHGLPSRRPCHHDRCTPDICRLATPPHSASLGPEPSPPDIVWAAKRPATPS